MLAHVTSTALGTASVDCVGMGVGVLHLGLESSISTHVTWKKNPVARLTMGHDGGFVLVANIKNAIYCRGCFAPGH